MNNPSLHILFISSWYPNRLQPVHGIFNRYFAQAAALYNKITVLNIVSVEDENASMATEITEEGNLCTVTVYYRKVPPTLPLISHYQRSRRVFKAAEEGMKVITESRGLPQVMQLNVVMPMGVAALHIAKKYNLPFVVNENWSGYTKEDGNYRGFIQKYFTRRIIRQAKKIMPTSRYLQEAMLSHGLSGDYRVVPNPVNTELFQPEPGTRNQEPGTRSKQSFIHISSLNDREKNVSGLIRAFSNASQDADSRLVIVGEGTDEPKYRQLVKELKLETKVLFRGRLLAPDLAKEINASDALLMFSNYETFCLVIIEAFACGKPVITSAAGAIPGYMDPSLGMLVPVGDEVAMTNAILKMLNGETVYDSEHIRQFALDNFSYQKVGSDLDEIYHQVLGPVERSLAERSLVERAALSKQSDGLSESKGSRGPVERAALSKQSDKLSASKGSRGPVERAALSKQSDKLSESKGSRDQEDPNAPKKNHSS